ncbi:multidrug effflux MFS transporter [Methylobacterium oryzisoli]|uniref:multidrug effflux MFS transporter n=1 Tax=Methylobacterium oryzisoli TaxID=3385502 RepID=UPI00389225CE
MPTDTRARPRGTSLRPESGAFTLLLGVLASLPTFGIDLILPTLRATGEALGAPSGQAGLAMSAYLLGLGAALPVYGPVADRLGRKPVMLFGGALMGAASLGCLLAGTLPQLLLFRTLQGAGAAGPGLIALTLVRDFFEGEAMRARMSFVVFAVNVVPMVAPSVGAVLLAAGGWRLVHAVPLAAGFGVLAVLPVVPEPTRRVDGRLTPGAVARRYLAILRHPVCRGYVLCNAAAFGMVFAYITGSSLVLIDAIGVSPAQYGLIFGASSLAVMAGALLNGWLAARGVSSDRVIASGLALATAPAFLLAGASLGPPSTLPVVLAMIGIALAFGLISPNAVNRAMQPHREIAGSVSAVVLFVQMAAAAASSALVSGFFDGHSARSLAVVTGVSCAAAIAAYRSIDRRERRASGRVPAASAPPLDPAQ